MKKYVYDPSNKLTRGVPVPAGWCPVVGVVLNEDGATPRGLRAAYVTAESFQRITPEQINRAYFDRLFGVARSTPEAVVMFRPIQWSADLLVDIPYGFEPYDRPGEPPRSTEGWMVVTRTMQGAARGRHFMFACDWEGRDYPLEEYGTTWCLARPAKHTCETCEDRGWVDDSVGGHGPAAYMKTTCPDCDTCEVAERETSAPLKEPHLCGACEEVWGTKDDHDEDGFCAACVAEMASDGWRVVDHPSRAERDAALIDALPDLHLGWQRYMGEARALLGPLVMTGRHRPSDDRLFHTVAPLEARDSTWMRGFGLVQPESHDERLTVQEQWGEDV